MVKQIVINGFILSCAFGKLSDRCPLLCMLIFFPICYLSCFYTNFKIQLQWYQSLKIPDDTWYVYVEINNYTK